MSPALGHHTATRTTGALCVALAMLLALDAAAQSAVATPAPLPTPETSAAAPSPTKPSVKVQNVERTLFDIYLADVFQGGVLAEYTESWLEIENPRDLIEQLKDLRKEQADELLPLVSGKIEGRREIPGVGSISFDIYTFRLVIVLAPEYLTSKNLTLNDRLPDPERGFSFQQNFGIAAAGELSGSTNSSFAHRSLFGSGRLFGQITGSVNQGEAYELSEASALGYFGDYELSSGYLETTGQEFANSLQFTGFRLRTADEILLDADRGTGSRFEVFIPSRSRVEFYRNERLLSVQLLDFGLQEIDTKSFPQGSYDVDVVITENSGSVTQFRKFFTKSGYLSVRGRPSIDLQLGAIRDAFSTTSTPVYQAEVRWRANDFMDLASSVYGTDELNVAQMRLIGLYLESFLQLGSSVSSEGDSGVSASASTKVGDFSLSVGGSKTLRASDSSRSVAPTPTPTPNPLAPSGFFLPTSRARELFFEDRSHVSTNLSYTVGRFEVSYQIQREQYKAGRDRYSNGPTVEARILDSGPQTIRFRSSRFETERGSVLSNSLSYRYKLSENWNLSAQATHYDREESGRELAGFLSINFNDGNRADNSNKLAYSADVRERSSTASSGARTTSFVNQLSGEYTSSFATASGFIRDESSNTASSNSSFGITTESAVVLSADGAAAVSAPLKKEAVFIADIKGGARKADFNILFDGKSIDTVESGKRSAIGVEPFKTYRISISPTNESGFVEYDTTAHQITFFPGNVVSRVFESHPVVIALGTVVDPQGLPVSFQRIRGPRDYVATDEHGFFQAELRGDEKLSIESRDYHCELGAAPQPSEGSDDLVKEMGELLCKSIISPEQ